MTVVGNTENLGFGRAVNRGAESARDADVLVLVNNDAVCAPDFVARMVAPFADPTVGMVAGVLLQSGAPGVIDSAGIELDTTLGSWDYLWNQSVTALAAAGSPVGPCGGAAAYRLSAFLELGGFDESLFAYWEDVDLALRLREAGGVASSRLMHARCTSTDRPWAPPRPRRDSRRSGGATCSPSTAWGGAIRFGEPQSPRSTGPCSPSTCSRDARPVRYASGFADARVGSAHRVIARRSSSRRLAFRARCAARRSSSACDSAGACRPISRAVSRRPTVETGELRPPWRRRQPRAVGAGASPPAP